MGTLRKRLQLLLLFLACSVVVFGLAPEVHAANYTLTSIPIRTQESSTPGVVLALNVTGASIGTTYQFTWTVTDPSGNARNAANQTVAASTTFFLSVAYPSKFGTNINYVGNYTINVQQNKPTPINPIATGQFQIGLTDSVSYQRTFSVSIKARGYNINSPVTLNISHAGISALGYPTTVTTDSTGSLGTSWTIPANVSTGLWTVSLTGSPDLDKLLQGGVKRGASVLIDLDSSVSPRVGGLLLYIITANCINQGGCAFIMPYSIFSSQNVADSLRPFIGNTALEERVRIAEYSQALPDEKWRVKLKGKMQEDFPIFSRCWNQLGAISNSRMLKFDFDKFAQIYGEEPGVPGAFEIGAGVRDSGAFMIGVASRPSPLREEFQRSVDYFLKMQSNGSLLIYGIKPFTNVHGIEFSFEQGYPRLSLMEIVGSLEDMVPCS